ncbi:MAG TPA: phosphoenolpyruvate carboxykinase (ATP), partial [candidate division Zixibacteria bacterium]|nr:phosphoenolpyruvate carboxykinase (ATP) [candidate division Zixibacteria bacterium]
LLGEKIDNHGSDVWLVNTGWTGGPAGVGQRMKLAYTRKMVSAVLSGELEGCELRLDPSFNLRVPTEIDGVPDSVLNPRETWQDKEAYDAQAMKLAIMFKENFEQFKDGISEEVYESGPAA